MHPKIIRITEKDNYRIVAISDVHGHLDLLKSLLEKVNLQDDDYLILLGDFINKGPNNLEILYYVMDLSKRPRTLILKGNHEYFICHYILYEKSERFLRFIKEKGFNTIIHDMLKELNIQIDTIEDMHALSDILLKHYSEAFDFMNHLPIIAYFDDTIFVHGGYDRNYDVTEDEYKYLKYDDFNNLSPVQEERVIVGHWPTSNLRKNRNSNAPYFNHDKNIIFIDGAVGVKTSGELNALILKKTNGSLSIDYQQQNNFEKALIIKDHYFEQEKKTFINYPHLDIDVIEKGDVLSLCRHKQTGNLLSVFNALLQETPEGTFVKTTYINHLINLKKGDYVEVCSTYGDCVLVKHNDEFGWIMKYQLG